MEEYGDFRASYVSRQIDSITSTEIVTVFLSLTSNRRVAGLKLPQFPVGHWVGGSGQENCQILVIAVMTKDG